MFIYTPKETHKEMAPQTWQILERNVSQEAEGYSPCLTCPISDLIWTVFNMEFE